MHTARKAGVALQIAAIAWAGILALAGLWFMVLSSTLPMIPSLASIGSGVALLGAAQFIYMTLFADRLFPHVHSGLRIAAEFVSFFMFAAGSILTACFLIRVW